MQALLDTVRRTFDAAITALAVFFGLEPDPTMIPVEQEVRIDR